ncbi:hypothetical protein CDAR_95121 [Caerostris darwini]|uniref:Uncharacterized protein n=1 Tax=Caerostris darwini TaxID=1538125 RepID=A0AAV4PL60_9ARAC|nr:hypothetical protein CDAR_95121 [Caerostris darwini]
MVPIIIQERLQVGRIIALFDCSFEERPTALQNGDEPSIAVRVLRLFTLQALEQREREQNGNNRRDQLHSRKKHGALPTWRAERSSDFGSDSAARRLTGRGRSPAIYLFRAGAREEVCLLLTAVSCVQLSARNRKTNLTGEEKEVDSKKRNRDSGEVDFNVYMVLRLKESEH